MKEEKVIKIVKLVTYLTDLFLILTIAHAWQEHGMLYGLFMFGCTMLMLRLISKGLEKVSKITRAIVENLNVKTKR